jgi:hypothetical protein
MLSGTSVAAPQLDEFIMDGPGDREPRQRELELLGWNEADLMR